MAKQKIDLSRLPLHIVKVNGRWYRNMKTMAWIKASNITDHLPKEEIQIEVKPLWHHRYENY